MRDRRAMAPESLDFTGADLQDLVARTYYDWESVNASAAAYLHALDVNDCHGLEDPVGNEDARTQVQYFLAHAGSWRGPTARAVKAELRRRLAATA